MKVLHLPVGRQMIEMCTSLRNFGVEAHSCHFRQRNVTLQPDICLHLDALSGEARKNARREFLAQAVEKYDIFHFHFGETFFKDRSDLEFLKKHGKKLVVQHRGSDVRMLSIARIHNPYVRVKGGRRRQEDKIIEKLKELSEYIDDAIVADHELYAYIEGCYKHIHILRQFVTVQKYSPLYPSPLNTKPLVIHAPTNTYLKGTEFILNGINELRKKGVPFEFKLIENMPHSEAVRYYRKADIIIDQLLQGSFGVFSLEGMALGKPVVCFIREDLKHKYPPGLPIVNADKETFTGVLESLIRNPSNRNDIGIRGRAYIKAYYDSRVLVKQLKAIYDKL